MAKLDTTIDNLERKSNKVTGSTPSANWTDAQYPSAKTLYNTYNKLLDLMHPIGSILTTASNVNPAATLGGTWTLVDKAFKDTYITLDSSYWTNTNAELADYSNIMLNNHTVSMRLQFKITTTLSDSTVELGKLDLTSCGITNLAHAIFYDAIISDGGNCTLGYRFDTDGTILIYEVLNVDGSHSMDSGLSFYIHLVQPVKYTNMLDEFCDKFYWKRTA